MTRPKSMSNLSQIVLDAYRANPSASLNELAKATGYSRTSVYYHLDNLQKQGIVIRVRRERAAKNDSVAVEKKKVNISFNAGDAFRPNAVSKVRESEQKRIDMVVKMVEEKEANGIISTGVNIFFDRRVRRVLGRKAG
jgi:biotin operon repressor